MSGAARAAEVQGAFMGAPPRCAGPRPVDVRGAAGARRHWAGARGSRWRRRWGRWNARQRGTLGPGSEPRRPPVPWDRLQNTPSRCQFPGQGASAEARGREGDWCWLGLRREWREGREWLPGQVARRARSSGHADRANTDAPLGAAGPPPAADAATAESRRKSS